MGRIAGRPTTIEVGLMLIVALLVASSSLGSPADDPKVKTKTKSKVSGEKKAEKVEKTEKERKQDEVTKVAETYLILLDKGKYGESWEAMSAHVRKGITRRKWVDLLGKTRTPYGGLQGRRLKKVDMRATEVADKFDEAWVYSEFRTVEGESASELVIVTLEKGKDWVVESYYIGDPADFPKQPAQEEEPAKPAKK